MNARIGWIDISKAIGIILVMLGHCYLDSCFVFWFTSFHMALFFLLSGYTFSTSGNYFSFLKKKVKTLLIPYFFFVLLTMLINGSLAITHGKDYDIVQILILYLLQSRYTLLWFLPCLFIATNIVFFIGGKIQHQSIWLCMSLLFLILFFLYKKFLYIDLPWNIDLSLLGSAFIFGGQFIKQLGIIRKVNIFYAVIAFVLSIVFSVVNLNYIDKVDWSSNSFGNPILFLLSSVLGSYAVFLISMYLRSRILLYIGAHSLVFYALHRIIIDAMLVIYGKFDVLYSDDNLGLAILSVVTSILILCPVNYLMLRFIPWCIGAKK